MAEQISAELNVADEANLIELTAHIVGEYVSQNSLRPEDLPGLIASTHGTLAALANGTAAAPEPSAETFTPAVTARKSLSSPDTIISMIDGKPYRTLKRHLSGHGLTPEQYRERYKLPASYPMVAPGYSAQRSAMAKTIGLGRKPGQNPGKAK